MVRSVLVEATLTLIVGALAAEITTYEPDSSWSLARDENTDEETPDGE